MKRFLSFKNWLDWLLILLPIAVWLELTHSSPVAIFVVSCLAVVPLAGYMGKATEHLAERLGAGAGGLLNATFGNAAELIIAALALRKGLQGVVKASITGSIIGNILLVLGLSVFLGGCKFSQQKFNRTAAALGSTLLALSVIGLLVPALFHHVAEENIRQGSLTLSQETTLERELSLEISVILFVVYALSLLFSLSTHKDLFRGEDATAEAHAAFKTGWDDAEPTSLI